VTRLDLEGVAADDGVGVQAVDAAVGDVGEVLLGANDGVVATQLLVGDLVDLHLGGSWILGEVL
jgi:hypothetical protein